MRPSEKTPFRSSASWSTAPSYSLLAGLATPFARPTTQGIDDGDDAFRLSLAASYLRAAMNRGRSVGHMRTPDALHMLERYHSVAVQSCIWLASLALLGLAFVEDGPNAWSAWSTQFIEAACLLLLITTAKYEHTFMGANFAREYMMVFHATILALIAIEFVFTVINLPGSASYRYARAMRPLLLLKHSPHLRERLIDMLRVGYGARMSILLLFFNLLMFTMAAITLFHATDEGREHFGTFGDALTTMIVLQTTCNSPGVLMPAFATDRSSSLFFVAFLIVAHFFLINLILGAVYNVHKTHLREAASYDLLEERVAARCVLAALTDDIDTGRNVQVAPFDRVCTLLTVEFYLSERDAGKLIRHLGGSSEIGVPRAVFNELPLAVKLQLVGVHPSSDDDELGFLQRVFSLQASLPGLGEVNVVLFLVSVILFTSVGATAYFMYDNLDDFVDREPRDLFFINAFITLIFALEMLGKLVAWGVIRFSDNPWNLFDLCIVSISVSGLLGGLLGWIDNSTAIILRDARLLRLVRVVPAFRLITGTASAFAPAAAPFFAAAACVFYSTAIIVVGVLGSVRLAPQDYRGNDFRDFAAAMLTLFELAVVNDWNLTMHAYSLQVGKSVRAFFVLWWSVSTFLMFNSVTSLVLEGFDNQFRGRQLQDASSRNFRRMSSTVDLLDLEEAKKSSSFTLGRLFMDLFQDLDEPPDADVDEACWERGVRVGRFAGGR